MSASDLFDEALTLEVDDRLRLIELLWDSLATQAERVVVTEAQRRVLTERLAEHECAPDGVVTRDDLKAGIRLR